MRFFRLLYWLAYLILKFQSILYFQMHSFYSVSVLFKTRFRAGGESNVNYIPLQSHHIVHVAPLLLKYPCNSSMGWVCTEFPLCVFLPFIIHASSFSKLLFGTHSGDNIIYVLWLGYSTLSSLYWQETRVLLVVLKLNVGCRNCPSLLRKAPFLRKRYCKLYCYKWCVSSQDIPFSMTEVSKCSFSIQWKEPLEKQAVKDTFLKSGKSMGR